MLMRMGGGRPEPEQVPRSLYPAGLLKEPSRINLAGVVVVTKILVFDVGTKARNHHPTRGTK